jgi:threonylcarbamoyladenosine tRNA methylthiotransferase CDKAL1
MDDIEDLEDVGPDPRSSHAHVVGVEHRGRQGWREAQSPPDGAQSSVPGTQRIWLKTFGCSHNTSDAEFMAGMLTEYGYR